MGWPSGLPCAGPDLVSGRGDDPLVGQPVERPQLIVVAAEAPGVEPWVVSAERKDVERRDAVLIEKEVGGWGSHGVRVVRVGRSWFLRVGTYASSHWFSTYLFRLNGYAEAVLTG